MKIHEILCEANIVNMNDVDYFSERFISRTRKPEVQAWLRSNLRRYVINKYPEDYRNSVKPLTLKDDENEIYIGNPASFVPLKMRVNVIPNWVKPALERGDEVLWFETDSDFYGKILGVIDYLNDLDQAQLTRIPRLSVPDAIRASEHWHDELTKKSTREEDLSGLEDVIKFQDGYKWVSIHSQHSLEREGEAMGHCVGGEDYWEAVEMGDTMIFSLRDPSNFPHITVEYNTNDNDLVQVKGKQNDTPHEKYFDYLKDFLQYMIDEYDAYIECPDVQDICLIKDDEIILFPADSLLFHSTPITPKMQKDTAVRVAVYADLINYFEDGDDGENGKEYKKQHLETFILSWDDMLNSESWVGPSYWDKLVKKGKVRFDGDMGWSLEQLDFTRDLLAGRKLVDGRTPQGQPIYNIEADNFINIMEIVDKKS